MDTKRFKWVFIVVMLVVAVAAQVGMRYARQIPVQQRGTWMIAIMALIVVPLAFMYGRNSARRDGLGKLSRVFVCGAVVCVLVGMFLGRQWFMFEGLGAGFLIGYALGWLVQKKAREKYGDSLEADQFLNIARSERAPRPESPILAYLKSQDKPTQRLLRALHALQAVALLVFLAPVFWLMFSDVLTAVVRALYVHAGDGTRYFIALDPIYAVPPLFALVVMAYAAALVKLFPILAGAKRDAWTEYYRLLSSRNGPAIGGKLATVIASVFLCATVVGLVLCFNTYVKVTDNGIAINRFWGLGVKFYHWNEVREVEIGQKPYFCKNGHQHSQLTVRIAFTDGSDWVPDTSVARRTPQIEAAARYVAARKGF